MRKGMCERHCNLGLRAVGEFQIIIKSPKCDSQCKLRSVLKLRQFSILNLLCSGPSKLNPESQAYLENHKPSNLAMIPSVEN